MALLFAQSRITHVEVTHELSSPDTQLELDGAALRALVDEVVDRLATYLDSVGQQPASAPIDEMAPIARALAGAAMPETGQPVHAVLDTISSACSRRRTTRTAR